MDESRRPAPEALLAALPPEHRGRLKVFLGAAPGVGKTYAMLQAGGEARGHGVDVIVGLAECHGRAETEALLVGLEVLPRARLEYRGHFLEELDLDGLLARRPRLALVDELAHTNAPGARHPKRFLDVDELLDAGIDVWTTVNIQHLASLNDAVAQITGIRVQETVPDRFFERADELEVVDLPPEDLLRRLDEGKVYVPETAQQALRRFFRPGNLTALRELALRQAAQRIGTQMRTYMQAHAIPGPWPTEERIVVCVSPSPLSPRLVRAARRMAERRRCDWLAVYVKGARHYQLTEADRDRVVATLRLAEELGGEAVTIPGEEVAGELIRYAQQRNATEIVIGKSLRSWWQELVRGSIVQELIRKSGSIDIYVITGTTDAEPCRSTRAASPPERPRLGGYAAALAAVALAGLAARLLEQFLSLPNLSMVFLLPVLYAATALELGPAVFAAVASLLAYDFFFVPPLYRFTVANPQDVLALLMYLVVAVLTSNLTARVRAQAEAARRREAQTAALFALSRAAGAAAGLDELLDVLVRQVADSLSAEAAVLLPEQGRLVQRAAWPTEACLTEAEAAAATWAWQHHQPTGAGSDTLPGLGWYCLPLGTAEAGVGALAVRTPGGRSISPAQRRLLEALGDLAAVAIARLSASRPTTG